MAYDYHYRRMSLLQAADLTQLQHPTNFFFIHWCGILLWVAGINMLIAAILISHGNQIHNKELNHVNWFPWDDNHRDKRILPKLQHTPACRGSYKLNTINEPNRHEKTESYLQFGSLIVDLLSLPWLHPQQAVLQLYQMHSQWWEYWSVEIQSKYQY